MNVFILVWLGQVVSLLGSKLTEFALGVWVFQQTQSTTQFGLILLFSYLPNILLSPIAGTLVDRWNRRYALILSDTAAGLTTVAVMILVGLNRLEIGHIYWAVATISVFNAFQTPAYTAAIAQLVPKDNLSRANGLVQISRAIAKILAPVLGGTLVGIIGLRGVMSIDVSTFLFALVTLLIVRFPKTCLLPAKTQKVVPLWSELVSGWNYIKCRRGLLKLLSFVAVSYFTMGVLEVIFWPFVLNISSSQQLGRVLSVGGCGMLLGSAIISVWGGPKRRVYGVLSCVLLQGLFIVIGGFQASVILAGVGIFGYLFAQPIIISCNQAIWQSKVPQALQGRVFALQQMLERSLAVVAYITAGPLVDQILNPIMAQNGLLSQAVDTFMGVGGDGQGVALLLILVGLLNIVAAIVAYGQPSLRRVEKELPDAGDLTLTF